MRREEIKVLAMRAFGLSLALHGIALICGVQVALVTALPTLAFVWICSTLAKSTHIFKCLSSLGMLVPLLLWNTAFDGDRVVAMPYLALATAVSIVILFFGYSPFFLPFRRSQWSLGGFIRIALLVLSLLLVTYPWIAGLPNPRLGSALAAVIVALLWLGFILPIAEEGPSEEQEKLNGARAITFLLTAFAALMALWLLSPNLR